MNYNRCLNVILCGYDWAGCKALELLLRMGHNVFVFTHDSPYHIPNLAEYCSERKIPYSYENISDTKLPFLPDIICSIYYRFIISKNVIDSCSGKIFNLHPSLLPKYRGCSSLTWAIINGEKYAGFTYHYIDKSCDTGDIIIQEKIEIEDFDTQQTLYSRAMFFALQKFIEAFNHVVDGKTGKKQEGEHSYYKRGCPYNGQLDILWSLEQKRRFIRAMIHPPYPVAKIGDSNIYTFDDLNGIT